MGSGAPSAMTSGISRMPEWCAGEARKLLWWVPRSNKLVGCAQHRNMDSRELGIHSGQHRCWTHPHLIWDDNGRACQGDSKIHIKQQGNFLTAKN